MNQAITRRRFVGVSAALASGAAFRPALAQSMPENLRIVCGFAPGGTSDTISRRIGERLAGNYARSVVVENRAGAGGRIAIDAVKAAPADGSVMLLTPGSMLFIYPHIYKQLSYNPFADLAPVSVAANIVHGLAVGPGVPDSVRNVADFVAWCKANPAKANYGSPAAGSTPHFIGTMIARSAGVPMTHIGFKGTQLAIVDMMGGQVPAVIGPDGEFLPHMKSGRVRMLATSGPRRSPYHPEVPTFAEQGLRDIQVQEWFGFFMPARTPADAVNRAVNGIRAAQRNQSVQDAFNLMGLEAANSTPSELAARLKADHDFWGPIVRATGFTAEN